MQEEQKPAPSISTGSASTGSTSTGSTSNRSSLTESISTGSNSTESISTGSTSTESTSTGSISTGSTSTGEQAPVSIREAQQLVDNWIKTVGVRYFSELTNMAILTEEVGEVARLMSRLYGDQSFKESDKNKDLGDELADVLWVLLCIANQTGVDLTTSLEKNFTKKSIRDATRHQNNEKLK